MDYVKVAVMQIIRIMGPDATNFEDVERVEGEIKKVIADIDWFTIEDNINSYLPKGFYCKIEE